MEVKMLKKILALLLCAFTLTSVAACGKDSDKENSSESTVTSEDAALSGDSTTSEESSEGEDSPYVDKDGYAQFLKASKVDKLLEKRGFLDKGANSDYVPLNYDKMKAMWISQFDFQFVYSNGRGQRSEDQFRTEVAQAYDNLVSLGFNTVIVQVRPNADSFYPSAYYPYSHYVMGSYGKNATYDPMQIMIDLAHEKKLSFHAWINPMRGMSSSDLSKVKDVYPVTSWGSMSNKKKYAGYLFERSSDGLLYLNIAYKEIRSSIINGAAEIVRHYDVDGVHMDDYFYFGEVPEFDAAAFGVAKQQDATLTRQKFRYNNLNTLVSGIYSAIKEENKNVMFGISPAGNLSKMANEYFVDINTWLSEDGYLDYIMPQIYFGMEHETWGFADTYERWEKITLNPKIKFMPGLTLGKAVSGSDGDGDEYAGTGKDEWIKNKDVIKRCLEYSIAQDKFDGYAIFSYKYLWDAVSNKVNSKTDIELKNCKKYFTTLIKGEPIKY
jgi:uncharacterized lipoprotein YddW (UPF0748 family)